MSQHTEGPWIADGAQIFTSDTNVAQANGYRIDRETVAANARLIAAAPELLEALEQMVSVFLDTEGRHGESKNDAMDAARAAIAKATGENT